MHIAIVNITSGGLSGGYRKYLSSILPRIERDPRVKRVELFIPPGSLFNDLVSNRAHSWPAGAASSGFPEVKAKLHQMRPDVVFVPTARWLDCGDTPVISMVRNMEPLLIPFSPRHPVEITKNLARRYAAFKSCIHSDGVIAVSSFVQQFLHVRWRIRTDKLAVVYHGVDSPDSQLDPRRPETVHIPSNQRFLFTAGSIRPARGLEDAIKAVANTMRDDCPISLAIAGAVDPRMHGYWLGLQRLANELGCSKYVQWMGSLDTAGMNWAFANCTAFVMSSRAEACPNTALEAMAHGCVCVSTDTAPMPEIFADAAAYYSAGDSGSLSNALRLVLSSDTKALSGMRNRALKRAMHFSWDRTARATVDFLETRSHTKRLEERGKR